MEKILQAIASLVEELKSKDNKILELERKLDGCLLELEDKNKKINDLETENAQLKLEKINQPLQPNPSSPYVPSSPYIPNNPWTPNQPTPSIPDWPYWPPYGPVISYVSTNDGSYTPPYFQCNISM